MFYENVVVWEDVFLVCLKVLVYLLILVYVFVYGDFVIFGEGIVLFIRSVVSI